MCVHVETKSSCYLLQAMYKSDSAWAGVFVNCARLSA